MEELPLSILFLFVLLLHGAAQGQQQRTLDPTEVEALRVFGSRIGLSPAWNFSVDPCSGLYGWNNTAPAERYQPASGVQCDCSGNSSVCHVLRLVVFNMNVAGEIPPETGNFSSLFDLNLGQNMITGTLPAELGSLSNLLYFNIGINRLRGPLPASFGRLTQLRSMGIGTNYLTGSLPPEIGNLRFLEQLYMDSSGLSGEIPPQLESLQRLQILSISDNNFNGSIDVLGNLSSLQELTMEGNRFRGQLPSSLGALQNLTKLYIGDVSAGARIPESLNRLSLLSRLSLRNCELSGSIPDFSNMTRLVFIDLSFNQLTGVIPSSLASLPSLENLVLANNNLNGEIPAELGSLTGLGILDVSFNNLTGALPSSLNRSRLQENIIWNSFNVSNAQGQTAAEMNCLETRMGCNAVDAGRNFELSINCGGPAVSADGMTFTEDSSSLSEAVYYSNSSQSWAVSSTGYVDFNGNTFNSVPTAATRVTGTRDSSLYQTARASPTSLKYFGLGMVNGPYQVDLHFAEIVIQDDSSGWTGLGRRFFDVYIQGSRVLQDFDIRAEANGSYIAIVRPFPAQVSNNVLEIHLLWRGKGTCCSPAPLSFGPLISAIRVRPEFDTSGLIPATPSPSSDSKVVPIGVGVGVSVAVVFLAAIFAILFIRKRRRLKYGQDEEDLRSLEAKPNLYSYNDLKIATRGFAPENKLGQGGFGSVYKGVLPNGTIVAMKELSSKSNQGTREFLNEVTVISAVQHRNLVKLHGCCIEGSHRILIYEFLENNSLHQALLKPKERVIHFDWPTRFNICVGIARGIAYLHEESLPRIVHRDIKASNVLLDKTLNPKIADFGLAKLFKDHQTHVSTRVAGTIGYLSPEYAMRGQLTEKADVYSFGVLVLEVVSGRDNLDTSLPTEMIYLLEWAWHLHENNRALELLDPEVPEFDEGEVLRVIQVALLCSQALASARPTMSHAVAMLLGTATIDVTSLQPGYFAALQNAAPGFYTDALVKMASNKSSSIQSSRSPSSVTSNSNMPMNQPR
ncbi:probable LRR receptor-like serine/threonine-protein kinase At1g56140 [Selaginella moellendorffii]|uniref:probable LRR receptor-like serine/threonine-protein kinase At1g56140 n=1 Tax=Selaginella moellendorffii TaxID=88036 RepID=UPI000D1C40B6|nr:probable LRR receptor-like serine/threonine-protein kinase At1g56140 [Selaginella moellendorffii]|eukprot:XP_024525088.1 probable LRR receptor-like serine/threonine-protein kinase At1g56140 [Selaginella moellendorffii]